MNLLMLHPEIKFIDPSVKWILSNFGINNKTNVINFGCGPGLYTTRLAEQGAKVTGIDFSKWKLQLW
jgi:2-polyprenyl-3-methyl-5-hydroxy-6-metoxy-1,4-benzoquinol methylase